MLFVSLLLSTIINPSEHRVVEGETGNCVFSAEGLPFQKEATYKPATEFTTENPIAEWRCYYAKQVKEYSSKGAFYNQMREDYEFWTYLTIEVPGGGRTGFEALGTMGMSDGVADWDQQRFIAMGDRCYTAEGSCIDIDHQVRLLAREEGAELPYTAEVCFSASYKSTDHYEEQWDDFNSSWKKVRTQVQTNRMAMSCVTHTALPGMGKPLPPKAGEPAPKKKKKKKR